VIYDTRSTKRQIHIICLCQYTVYGRCSCIHCYDKSDSRTLQTVHSLQTLLHFAAAPYSIHHTVQLNQADTQHIRTLSLLSMYLVCSRYRLDSSCVQTAVANLNRIGEMRHNQVITVVLLKIQVELGPYVV
jgi:hypothetical protein